MYSEQKKAYMKIYNAERKEAIKIYMRAYRKRPYVRAKINTVYKTKTIKKKQQIINRLTILLNNGYSPEQLGLKRIKHI